MVVFASVEFLFFFLPLFILAQNFFPHRNLSYVLFSLFFYFIGEGWYTSVVIVFVLMNYLFGLLIEGASTTIRRKVLLASSITTNLTILFFFKYSGFFLQSIFGIGPAVLLKKIHLPLGISFFTFHSMSYLIDVYRRDAKAERSLVNISLYILMFPQLIAGPILRFHTVAQQLNRRIVGYQNIYFGSVLFCFGLGQKVLLADPLAAIADPLFARKDLLLTSEAWLAAISYTLQIFHDFSGYTNMAIGLGWITGFNFPRNFAYPYISRSITEFWRRWHISLSRWFRDYLYISLGGNRGSHIYTYRNLFTVFLLCGLWHGAEWTFVVWGLYHGLLLVIERIGFSKFLENVPKIVQHCYAIFAVLIGWVIFRANSLKDAGRMLNQMVLNITLAEEASIMHLLTIEQILILSVAFILSYPVVINLLSRYLPLPVYEQWHRQYKHGEYVIGIVIAFIIFCLASAKIITGAYSPFIYFRF